MPESPEKTRAPLPSLGGTLGFGDPPAEPFCVCCNKHFATQDLCERPILKCTASHQSTTNAMNDADATPVHTDSAHLSGQTHRAALQRMGRGGLFGCEKHYAHISTLLEPVQPRESE